MKIQKTTVLILICILMGACNTSQVASNSDKPPKERRERPPMTLADHLRGIPGVDVSGAGENIQVRIRAAQSIQLSSAPIYTIDGVPAGNRYAQVASLINIEDIASVRVLKSKAETVMYGSQGVNGVIAIKLKKQ